MNNESLNQLAIKSATCYVISNIVVKAIGVITTPIFARLLTTQEYGVVSNFNSWNNLLLPIFSLCLTYSVGRAKLDYPDKLDDYIGSMQYFSLVISLLLSIIVVFFLEEVATFFELNTTMTLLLLAYLLLQPSIQYYQCGYKYKYLYKQNAAIALYLAIASSLTSLLLIWLCDGDRITLRVIGLVLPVAILSVYFWFKALNQNRIHYNKEFWKYGWSLSAPLILHTISLHILAQSDRIFIIKICGPSETGIYSIAYALGGLVSIIETSINNGWLPWFNDMMAAENFQDIKKSSKLVVIFICFIGLACIGLGPEELLLLGGEKYISGVACITPIILGIVCKFIYTNYVNIELIKKRTGYVAIGTIVASIFNIVTNAIFIPIFGYVAAAYTTFASYILLMIMHYCISRFLLNVKLYDDLFMFGAMLMTSIVGYGLSLTYYNATIRYLLTGIGFICFLLIFRKYIGMFGKKFIDKFSRLKP